jgi:hypothetical protein
LKISVLITSVALLTAKFAILFTVDSNSSLKLCVAIALTVLKIKEEPSSTMLTA